MTIRTVVAAGLIAALAAPGTLPAQVVGRGLPGAARDSAQRPAPSARGTVDGVVTDTALAPLLGAQVTVLSTAVRVGTAANGRFRISDVPAGEYVLIVRRAGFRPTSAQVTIAGGDTLRVAYMLERDVTMLPAAVVTEQRTSLRMLEFEARRRVGLGEFMSGDEIGQRASVYVSDLLRRFRSIDVSRSNTNTSGGMPDTYALSRREGGSLAGSGGYCPMAVIVDEVPMPTPFNLDLLPSPRLVAGIEVYHGPATIPPRYNGYNRGCGVILIWTKEGY